MVAFVSFAIVSIIATGSAKENSTPDELGSASLDSCYGNYEATCGGRIFYFSPTHHVESFQNPNTAQVMRNAVRYVSPSTIGPISVSIFANVFDHGQAILDSLSSEPDIAPVLTTDENDLLSLGSYDVVIAQSNGFDFNPIVEQSIADFHSAKGGVIGCHDIIWHQFDNPILEDIFAASAHGDGSVPGDGWYKGTVTVQKAIDHPTTVGVEDSWDLLDEQYFFDVKFKRMILPLLETNHSGNLIPIGWTSGFSRIAPPTNLTATVKGDDVELEWDNIDPSQVAYHLIYRATESDGFDFDSPIHNSSGDSSPSTEKWTDTGAAQSSSPREYYYVVRAVNENEIMSPTSLTVGKWTKGFNKGLNAFSLPLKPIVQRNISWFANDIPGVITLDWLDASGRWVRYNPLNPDIGSDRRMILGSTYRLFLSQQTTYTFVGYPGTMIRFTDYLGNSTLFKSSLTLGIQWDSVTLSWMDVEGATRYNIYRTTSREQLLDIGNGPTFQTVATSFYDVNVLYGFSGELIYTVIPEDDICGLGSSTYSRGVVKEEFGRGVQSFALELVPLEQHSIDSYTSEIEGVEGIAYVVASTWKFHSWPMPPNVYDKIVRVSEGYLISIKTDSTTYIYLGV